ncbi:hypothetical protein TNCV_737141 [Trichonephila clavipes]|nr:hypothetical protein TNCV_737141 [Trichonephila clavipes]
MGSDYIFMYDNAWLHRARIVNEFYEEEIRRMDWPSRSPGHNLTGYVWDGLGLSVVFFEERQELKVALSEECCHKHLLTSS